ncbi:MAG: glycosyltransferase family 4 protein [Candidatus Sumerlaeota bacterium]|nr:glycosyltransferase family 4 protein [Candidatus Sumerlaeota bacterium]
MNKSLARFRAHVSHYASGYLMAILVLTTEPLPLPGQVTTGAGLRAWGLAAGLAAHFRDVEIAMPNTACAVPGSEFRVPSSEFRVPGSEFRVPSPETQSSIVNRQSSIPLKVFSFERGALTEFVRRRNPDCVVMQHWGLMRELESCACPLAIDLAGPHLLERLYWKSPDPNADLMEKIDALARADYVVCSGAWQRHYFLSYMRMAGWDITAAADVCPVIPFSFSPTLPAAVERRDETAFVYGGVFLPWQDPEIALRSALSAMNETGRGTLHLYGGPHPQGDVSGGRFDSLWRDLSANASRAIVHNLTPFDQLLREYSSYGVAVDLMARNPERELAFTTRTVVYMACGLPVIYNDYSELSAIIRDGGAGWTLDPRDAEGVKQLVRSLLDSPDEVRRRGEAAQALVAERMNWERTIEPLAKFCRAPTPRLNKEAARLAWESLPRRVAELERERDTLASALDTLRGKWIVKIYERRARWSWLLPPLLLPVLLIGVLVLWCGMMLTRKKTHDQGSIQSGSGSPVAKL